MRFLVLGLIGLFTFSQSVFAQEFSNKLYGYSQLDFKSSDDPVLLKGFRVSRINLIDDFNLSNESRFVVDVEYEDGTDLPSDAPLKGSVKLSRGFFEYNFHSNTSISFGKILTPFGLLNETHDFTITYLPIEVPLPYRKFIPVGTNQFTRAFSKYSTGISVKDISKFAQKYNWTNQLTVANGATETNRGSDPNGDKLISLKSSLKYTTGNNVFETGLSGMTEKDSSSFGGSDKKRYYTYGAHFKFENDKINFSAEAFYSKFNAATVNKQEALAYYANLGYSVNETTIPYILYSKAYRDLSNKNNSDREMIFGLNKSLMEKVILKFEYTRSEREVAELEKKFQTLAADLAVAF